MTLELFSRARVRIRPRVAAFTALCGVATAAGSLLTWVSARGPRPAMGMAHTSLARMLAYSFVHVDSFWRSAAFAGAGIWTGLLVHHFNTPALPNSHYLNPANLPWADLRAGAWLTITGAAVGLVSAFWLRHRPAG